MELPEIITCLPEIELPLPPTVVKTNALKYDGDVLVFFHILKDVDLPAHSHNGQWGAVLEGQIELTVGGETGTYVPGDTHNIPAGIMHSGKLPACAKVIDFFEELDRYQLK